MTPWIEDRLLARSAHVGQTWTLERLHEALDQRSQEAVGRPVLRTVPRPQETGHPCGEPSSSSAASSSASSASSAA